MTQPADGGGVDDTRRDGIHRDPFSNASARVKPSKPALAAE
jgi:hypothetical protein